MRFDICFIYPYIFNGLIGNSGGVTVHLYDTYMERELLVTSKGIESSNVETDFNGAILYSLVERLKQSSLNRGSDWKSFVMSYSKGNEVTIKFDNY